MVELEQIHYTSGYKYQLSTLYMTSVEIYPDEIVDNGYVRLTRGGTLTVYPGFAWDGPSGPTLDTPNFMRGSLIHDALYQLMRQGELQLFWKKRADLELKKACLEDGMSRLRVWWVYRAVSRFGKGATLPENRRQVLTAP